MFLFNFGLFGVNLLVLVKLMLYLLNLFIGIFCFINLVDLKLGKFLG